MKLKSFFLFARRPEDNASAARRAAFGIWNIGLVLLSAVGLCLVTLLLSTGPYALDICRGYFEKPVIFLLNLLPCLALALIFYALCARAGLSFLLTAAVCVGLAVGNYYKLMFRDDPLMFADLLLLKEAGRMAGNYSLFIDLPLAAALVCVALGWLFLHLFVRGRPKLRGRLAALAAGVALGAAMLPLILSPSIYSTHAAYFEHLSNRWSSTQQYISRGFVYPFLHSARDAFEAPPEGYSEAKAKEALGAYEDADIPEDKRVNVVAIMLEAYNDFTKFGVPELQYDLYADWHRLEAEGYSGNLVTNIFAGGTVDTERCFLTGYSALNNFRGRTNSYAWYFREQGYTVEGLHPSYGWFYNRQNVNANLGFENYYFIENRFGELTGGGVAMDDIFFDELIKSYEAGTALDKPYFSFSVSYQGHGPYDDDRCYWGEKGDYVKPAAYTEQEQYILDNYFGSVADTTRRLGELADYLREDDEPTVLVVFGDHNPWMGDGNSVYSAMGLDFDLDTEQGFMDYYSTRYVIWANDAAKQTLGRDFQGEGPDIGPYFLMNKLFELCGWDGPAFMQAANETARRVSVVHTSGRYMEDGRLTSELSDSAARLVSEYKNIQYYLRHNFIYGD